MISACESDQRRRKQRWNQIKALLTLAVECVLVFYCTVNQNPGPWTAPVEPFRWLKQSRKRKKKGNKNMEKSPDCVGKLENRFCGAAGRDPEPDPDSRTSVPGGRSSSKVRLKTRIKLNQTPTLKTVAAFYTLKKLTSFR